MEIVEAKELARTLMAQHGLLGWRVAITNRIGQLGSCSQKTKTIFLSKAFFTINPPEVLRNTILHEIAHALAGCHNGHNRKWRTVAQDIGARPERLAAPSTVRPPRKYKGTCPTCGRVIYRMRRFAHACGICCHGTFDRTHLLVWSLNV